MNNLYLIAGPSGSGKTALVENLCEMYRLSAVVSYTTRPMREGEKQGREHWFVTKEEFDALEDIVAYTEFSGARYAATLAQVMRADLYVIDLDGIDYLKSKITDRHIVIIGVDPGPVVCAERMRKRGDSEEEIQERLDNDAEAFKDIMAYSNVMVDATLPPEMLARQAMAIIRGYEPDISSYEHLEQMFADYVAGDAEATDPEYVLDRLESVGCTTSEMKRFDLDWLLEEEE